MNELTKDEITAVVDYLDGGRPGPASPMFFAMLSEARRKLVAQLREPTDSMGPEAAAFYKNSMEAAERHPDVRLPREL